MSVSTGYVRTHIYIEDMRTKKALSAWIPLVSVFCSSGAVSGIRGKQMTPAVASEYGVPFVSKLKMMLVFTIHAGIYDSCWYLRSMLVFIFHAGIYDTNMKSKYHYTSMLRKYEHES